MNKVFLERLSLSDLDCLYRIYQERYNELGTRDYQSFDESEAIIAEMHKMSEEMIVVKTIRDEKFDMMRKLSFGSSNTYAK